MFDDLNVDLLWKEILDAASNENRFTRKGAVDEAYHEFEKKLESFGYTIADGKAKNELSSALNDNKISKYTFDRVNYAMKLRRKCTHHGANPDVQTVLNCVVIFYFFCKYGKVDRFIDFTGSSLGDIHKKVRSEIEQYRRDAEDVINRIEGGFKEEAASRIKTTEDNIAKPEQRRKEYQELIEDQKRKDEANLKKGEEDNRRREEHARWQLEEQKRREEEENRRREVGVVERLKEERKRKEEAEKRRLKEVNDKICSKIEAPRNFFFIVTIVLSVVWVLQLVINGIWNWCHEYFRIEGFVDLLTTLLQMVLMVILAIPKFICFILDKIFGNTLSVKLLYGMAICISISIILHIIYSMVKKDIE